MTQRPQDDRNQEATVYLVCVSRSAVVMTNDNSSFAFLLGQLGREGLRRDRMGTHASSWSCWCVPDGSDTVCSDLLGTQ